ncbi:MAG: aminotransferase class V-fold PLP-dependent enzyme [Bacteriovoracaceae bacterium]|nr:aminotransferase class V-fold PLP-dependent enzyme [Bacteriovoracaceae bacterium]
MKNLFNDDLSIIYLNSGTQSRPPIELIEEVDRLRKITYTNPTEMHILFPESLYQSHVNFSQFINIQAEDLFFCHNVTEALNHFILGTKLDDKAEIFAFDLEYGATVNICKYRAQKEKRKLHSINISQYFKDEPSPERTINSKILQDIFNLEVPRGSLFIMSHVLTTNGYILPIEKISCILKKKGAISVVDGAHAIGAFDINFSTISSVNFYGGNLHKWLMGMPGMGFGWINPKNTVHNHTLFIGWPNYNNAVHLDDFKLCGTAKNYYLKGTIDFAPFMAISKLMNWWKENSAKKIYDLRKSLRQELITGLSNNSELKLISSQIEKSPLLSYKLSDKYSDMGYKIAVDLFAKGKLSISSPSMNGETLLRLSPNVYNDSDEIQKAIIILNEYLK